MNAVSRGGTGFRMLDTYLDPCTVNSRKVLAGLDLIGAEHNFNHIDYFGGEHKKPEYLKINPNGTVPSAIDGDLTIFESNAILQYAGEKNNSPAYPKDLNQRTLVNSWLLWESSVWFASCYVYLVEHVVKPLLKQEPDQSVVDGEAPKWHNLASVLDAQLGKTKWLVGDEPTIADIAIASPMHLHEASRLPLDQHTNLKRWYSQVESLPCWQKTQDAVDKALLPDKAVSGLSSKTKPMSTENQIRTNFNYTKDVKELTELYFYEHEKAEKVHSPGDDPHECTVSDGWHRAKEFSIDKHGFSIHDFKSAHKDWSDDEAIKSNFYPEVVRFLQETTGAKRVLVFDHTIRSAVNEGKKLTQETNTSQRAPVMLVHCDYTAESGPIRVQQLLPSEATDLLTRRLAFINVWQPLKQVEERPLAMCDVTFSPSEDFFKLYLRYRDRTGENYVMRHSDQHKWWYFPDMSPEQVILLKTFDSADDGSARFVGHSAFEDPNSRPEAPMRESIEIRTIAFYQDL